MSDLQVTLIALGAVIIVCVLLYNWWQERKFRLEMASSFIEPKKDALIDDFKINAHAFEETELTHTIKSRLDIDSEEPVNNNSQLDSPDFNDLVFDENINEADAEVPAFAEDKYISSDEISAHLSLQPHVQASVHNLDDVVEPDYLNQTMNEDWSHAAQPVVHHLNQSDVTTKPNTEPNTKPTIAQQDTEKTAAQQAVAKQAIVQPVGLAGSTVGVPALPIVEEADSSDQIALPKAVDAKIDLTAILHLEKDLAKVTLNHALNDFIGLVTELDKPTHLFGLNVDGVWDSISTDITPNQTYTQLLSSLQLADRGGAVSRATLNRFQLAVELLGLELGTQVEWLGSNNPLEFSQQLDQFCIDVDKIIGFHLVQGESGAFHGTKLRGLAEANGFSLGQDGAFHYRESQTQPGEGSALLFSIIHQNNQPFTTEGLRNIVIKGITFQMDIPRVKNCVEVFNKMVNIAQKMQKGLGAHLVDDHQKPLTELQINKICLQLQTIHTVMLTYGISPGSPTALRLFV